ARDRRRLRRARQRHGRLRSGVVRACSTVRIHRHDPDLTAAAVCFLIDRRHDVRDRRAVGREAWIAELLEREIVLGGHGTRLREGGRGDQQERAGQGEAFHARALFLGSAARAANAAGVFLFAEVESRLLRSASMRLTTFGGASISGATISRPSILASMISRRPTWYSSL